MENNKGTWWLPEKAESKVSGDLTYASGKEATLSLDGSFEKPSSIFDQSEKFYEIILGEVNHQKITLVNSKKIFSQVTLSGKGDSCSSKFSPVVICKGHHFSNKKELEFSNIMVRYSHLRKWLGSHCGFRKEDNRYLKGFNETSLLLQISPNLRLEIKDFLQKENLKIFNYHIDKTTVIFSHEKTSISKILETLDIFRNFLQILIDEKIEILEIEAQEEYGNIQLIIPHIISANFKDSIAFIPEPITFKTFHENAESYLVNWFTFVKKFEPIYHLFFSDNFEKLYITTRFLNYAQAIEAYHSKKQEKDGNKFFSDTTQHILDDITSFSVITKEMFPENHASTILSKFQWLNWKTLRMRLKELYQEYPRIFPIFIRDKDFFINQFVEIRNYYTHYDSSKLEPNVREMIVLTENARFILLSILLKEIGFKERDIESAVYRYCRKRVTALRSLG